jgi:nickel superoxide dismutase
MKIVSSLIVWCALLCTATHVSAHCQVPCGIYDDKAELNAIAQHITTIEKAMNQIQALSVEGDKNYNQLVRWVNNKETHATRIQESVQSYFLAQRVKPVSEDDAAAHAKYLEQLRLLHGLIVEAMKTKQTTDLAHVANIRGFLDEFRALYLGPEGEEHSH